jgi:hypothetical protein
MIDIRYTVRRIRTCYFNCTGIMELIVKFYHSFLITMVVMRMLLLCLCELLPFSTLSTIIVRQRYEMVRTQTGRFVVTVQDTR